MSDTPPPVDSPVSPPAAPKAKKPWYLRWWVWLIGAIVLIVIISAIASGGGSDDDAAPAVTDDTTTTEPSEAPEEEPAEPEPDPAADGAAWADDTYGTFAASSQDGSGDTVIELPGGVTAGLVTASFSGDGNFAIMPIDADNESTGELLVNTIGAYTGTTAWGIGGLGEAVRLQVTANGPWTIALSPISTAGALPPSGDGDGVFLYTGSAASLTLAAPAEAHVAVVQDTGSAFEWGLLINEIGPYEGTVPIKAGPSLLVLTATGGWTASIQ